MKRVPKNLKGLFTSKIRIKILTQFLLNVNESFYTRQLEKILKEPVGPINRELHNLEGIDILESFKKGREKHYRINKEMFFFDALQLLFIKAIIGKSISEVLSGKKGIELVFIYGSLAKGEGHKGSDIDIMIIGDITNKELNKEINKCEKKLGKVINYFIYDREEIKDRLRKEDNFILTVFKEEHIILIGNEKDELFRIN
ncbi:nucleotidyltransferase domain-containing protein [Candidatus Dependentiae bacterium]|nr:nucleotidyltransferase domain-containing protein [Candidatus Dependentiae bacterium]